MPSLVASISLVGIGIVVSAGVSLNPIKFTSDVRKDILPEIAPMLHFSVIPCYHHDEGLPHPSKVLPQ